MAKKMRWVTLNGNRVQVPDTREEMLSRNELVRVSSTTGESWRRVYLHDKMIGEILFWGRDENGNDIFFAGIKLFKWLVKHDAIPTLPKDSEESFDFNRRFTASPEVWRYLVMNSYLLKEAERELGMMDEAYRKLSEEFVSGERHESELDKPEI